MSDYCDKASALLFELNRPADAEKLILEGLSVEPNDALLHCLLSHAQARQGRNRPAIESARSAIGLAPGFAYAHATLGWAYLKSNQFPTAARAFQQAVRCEPENAEYYFGWAESLRRQKLWKLAFDVASCGLNNDPRSLDCRNVLAACLMDDGNYGQATELLEETLGMEPGEAYTHALLGYAWQNRQRPLRAARYYLEAVRLNPGNRDNVVAFRELLTSISLIPCGIMFGLIVGAVLLLGKLFHQQFTWHNLDVVSTASFIMLPPLACLLAHDRIRNAVAFSPILLGRFLYTPTDRKLLFYAVCAYFMTAACVFTVALTCPRIVGQRGSEFLPFIASYTFPFVPILIWLEWQDVQRTVAAIVSLLIAAIQFSFLVFTYVIAATPQAERVFPFAFVISVVCLFSIIIEKDWID
jgi:tetratricopeptide (TPR) repeat protein